MEYLFLNPQDEQKAFLGKGWAFPPAFDRNTGKVGMAQYEEDIDQSLRILFSTSVRERVLQPEFGCNPEDYVFTALNITFLSYLEDLIRKNIAKFEPRIKVLSLVIAPTELEGMLEIKLDYVVRTTNTRYNIVYPFYKQEGTNVDV
ncbi:GPW/gp25 family protein [Chitinophaga sp. 22321]|uniref:GPW/gp25 family protein n=1 Tax=Chitinophaga hostae TaxID=2831022 RepID=A0ABS5J4C3_9BACT|nr:GPW/gp25 family protein [Chitinophaga hostae]MBS0030000.1 GPW/gp25 family protein [Chitinophaga hostae]